MKKKLESKMATEEGPRARARAQGQGRAKEGPWKGQGRARVSFWVGGSDLENLRTVSKLNDL